MIVPHDKLGVHQDVAAEDESGDDAVAQLDLAIVREEHGHEAEDDEHPERAKQVWNPAREVVLGLASEERERDEDAKREDESFDNDLGIVEGSDYRDGVRLGRSERA